jgi:hypothetical protein
MGKYAATRDCYFDGRYRKKGERFEADLDREKTCPPWIARLDKPELLEPKPAAKKEPTGKTPEAAPPQTEPGGG